MPFNVAGGNIAKLAYDNADQAINKANEADLKADDTQLQLETVVNRATDSDAMSAQAAVDAKGINKVNLKKRLDDDYNEVTSQLAQITNQSITKTVSKMAKGEAVKIVTCGDSITFAQDGANAGIQVPESERYPFELQRILRSIYNNPNISVINKGQPGWSSDTWARVEGRDFKSLVLAENPDMVITMLGINDVHADMPRETYRSNLEYLIKLCQDLNIDVILMSPTPTLQKTESSVPTVKQINMQIMEYAQICKNLANNKNVFFVDIQQEFLDIFYKLNIYKPLDIINPDFTHLNSYKLIANIIIKNLMASSTLPITGEQKIHAVGSPYIYTNLTKNNVATYLGISDYERNYYLMSDGGKYLRFRFNILKKGLNLKLRYNMSKVNGTIAIYDNGVKITDLVQHNGDNGTGANIMHSVAKTVIENLSVGFHEIVIDVANSVAGGTVTSPYQIIVEAFEFEENKDKELIRKKTVNSINGTKYTNVVGDIEIKPSKNLIVEYEGTLLEGMSFYMFSAKKNTTDLWLTEVLSVTDGKLTLTERTLFSQTTIHKVTTGITTIDLTKKHNVKIMVDSTKKYFVYIDGVKDFEIITSGNTVTNGKFAIVYNNTVADMLIDIDSLSVKYI